METQYSYVRAVVVLPLCFTLIIGRLLSTAFNVPGDVDKQEVSILLNVAPVRTYVVQAQDEARSALSELALPLCWRSVETCCKVSAKYVASHVTSVCDSPRQVSL